MSPSEEEEDGEGRKREGRACHGIIPSHAPAPYAPPTTPFQIKKKKTEGRNKVYKPSERHLCHLLKQMTSLPRVCGALNEEGEPAP